MYSVIFYKPTHYQEDAKQFHFLNLKVFRMIGFVTFNVLFISPHMSVMVGCQINPSQLILPVLLMDPIIYCLLFKFLQMSFSASLCFAPFDNIFVACFIE